MEVPGSKIRSGGNGGASLVDVPEFESTEGS